VRDLSNTWAGKARRCLLLDVGYLTDSERQQAAEPATALAPAENTLQSQQAGFLMGDGFVSLVLHACPARGKAHQLAPGNTLQLWSNQKGRPGQQAVPVAQRPIAQLGALLDRHRAIKRVGSRCFLRFGSLGVLAWVFFWVGRNKAA